VCVCINTRWIAKIPLLFALYAAYADIFIVAIFTHGRRTVRSLREIYAQIYIYIYTLVRKREKNTKIIFSEKKPRENVKRTRGK